MAEGMNQNAASQSHPMFDPRGVEGQSNSQAMNFAGLPQKIGVKELTSEGEFDLAIATCEACVIDVFTTWCGPCTKIKPFFATLPERFNGFKFFNMDLDKNKFLGQKYSVTSIPTFLFIYKGKIVKTMAGADEGGIISNISWMVNTYKIENPQDDSGPKKKAPYRIFKENGGSPVFFETTKWERVLPKIKEALAPKGISDAVAQLLEKGEDFENETPKNKILVAENVIQNLPLDDPELLNPCVNLLAMVSLIKEGNEFIAEKGDTLIHDLTQKYFIQNSFTAGKEKEVRGLRVFILRLLANLMKHPNGSNIILCNYDVILMALNEIMPKVTDDGLVSKTIIIALNNFIFAEFGLDIQDELLLELTGRLVEVIKSVNEDAIVGAMNIMCKILDSEEVTIRQKIKDSNSELLSRLQTTKYHKNKTIAYFSEDLIRLMY